MRRDIRSLDTLWFMRLWIIRLGFVRPSPWRNESGGIPPGTMPGTAVSETPERGVGSVFVSGRFASSEFLREWPRSSDTVSRWVSMISVRRSP